MTIRTPISVLVTTAMVTLLAAMGLVASAFVAFAQEEPPYPPAEASEEASAGFTADAEISCAPEQPARGQLVDCRGATFRADSELGVRVSGATFEYETGVGADADGEASYRFEIPADAPEGSSVTVAFRGVDPHGEPLTLTTNLSIASSVSAEAGTDGSGVTQVDAEVEAEAEAGFDPGPEPDSDGADTDAGDGADVVAQPDGTGTQGSSGPSAVQIALGAAAVAALGGGGVAAFRVLQARGTA